MGKNTGFLEYERADAPYRPVAERLRDFREAALPLSDGAIVTQAARCMECGIPFCHAMGCPVYNLIPEFNDYVYRGQWQAAYERLSMVNTLPEITGRVCPAPCETSCTLSINSSPVAIKQIERTIIEHAFAQGWVVPLPPSSESGKKIAVIGSGPAGLACAMRLRRSGHAVTVYEQDDNYGGILRYGIPDFKLEKNIIDRRLALMEAEGVHFENNVSIGADLSARYLQRTFDAVVLTVGAQKPRDLPAPGQGLEGIHFAMDYLVMANKISAGRTPAIHPP
ncbi:MAG: glutamate synthase subunit beta, partial [Chitinivibrionales bacterium]|nr:glutamate synthase subunit beta [Chitinivibrionales bacterium]